MYEFQYAYLKPKYCAKAKLSYMNTDSFIIYIKTDDIYKDIAEDVETRFDTLDYELGGIIMIELVRLRAKTYSCLIDDGSEDKKQKVQNCLIERKLKFENYKNCLKAIGLDNKIKLSRRK